MILTVDKYEHLLTAVGQGAFGRLEFEGDLVNLRTFDVKQLDGYPKIYFDGRRVQVITGLRYQPVMRKPYAIVPNLAHKVITNVMFVKPLPEGMYALVVPVPEYSMAGGAILSAPLTAGFQGSVSFTTHTLRGVEVEDMTIIARLMFFGNEVFTVEKPPVKRKSRKTTAKKELTAEEKKAAAEKRRLAAKEKKNANSTSSKSENEGDGSKRAGGSTGA